ncbi:MAG: hypothetical protein AAGG75_14760 [Bacteroidota bacterium]
MKRPPSAPSKTFRHLRQLPLEVSFAQVEDWVRNAPPPPARHNSWIAFFLRYFFSSDS